MGPRDVFYLNEEQFNKIVELLTPGYELALAYKAQMAAQPPTPPTGEPATSSDDVAT